MGARGRPKMDPEDRMSKIVQVRVWGDLLVCLESRAKELDVTMSNLCRALLLDALEAGFPDAEHHGFDDV